MTALFFLGNEREMRKRLEGEKRIRERAAQRERDEKRMRKRVEGGERERHMCHD